MRTLMIFAALSLSIPAVAADAPTPEEINKVMNYYKEGKDDGPILIEGALCGKVNRKTKECENPVGDTAEKATYELKMRWFVPKDGTYDDIRIEWVHEGEVRRTSDLKLTASMNYRTWKAKGLKKPGKWEVRISRKVGGEKVNIKTIAVNIQ